MRPSQITCGVLFSALVLASSSVHAQESETPEVRAERLFKEAAQHFDAGRTDAACETFSESLRLAAKLGTLLNLALCHETQGRVATAWNEFLHGAAWAAQNGQKDRQQFAHEHAIALEPKLPRLLLRLPEAPFVTEIEIDGEPLPEPTWSLPHYLDPGAHTVAASAPGKRRASMAITVTPGPSLLIVDIPLLESDARSFLKAPSTPARAPSSPNAIRRPLGYGFLGFSAVALGLGAVGVVSAIGSRDDSVPQCTGVPGGVACTQAGLNARDDARVWANVATVSGALAVVSAGVGAYLLYTAPPVPAPVRERPRVLPALSSTGGMLLLQGSL